MWILYIFIVVFQVHLSIKPFVFIKKKNLEKYWWAWAFLPPSLVVTALMCVCVCVCVCVLFVVLWGQRDIRDKHMSYDDVKVRLSYFLYFCCEVDFILCTPFRSSHSQLLIKIDALKNFAKFTGKHIWRSLLIKLLVFR